MRAVRFRAGAASYAGVSQDLFRIRSHLPTLADAHRHAHRLSLGNGVAERIICPLLIAFGAEDRIIPASEGQRLAQTAAGPVDFVVYPEGNHVCFNIPYKFRPLTADWMAERLAPNAAKSSPPRRP